jgi:hypothetical protein
MCIINLEIISKWYYCISYISEYCFNLILFYYAGKKVSSGQCGKESASEMFGHLAAFNQGHFIARDGGAS